MIVATLLVVLTPGGVALGQDAAGEASGGSATRLIDHFVVKGGPITWFALIPLSVAALALTVEHSLTIRRKTFVPPEVLKKLQAHFRQQRYAEAMRLTATDASVLSYAVRSALSAAPNGFAAMERSMEDALDERASRLHRKIEYLNIIGNVGPMIGLFGTVYGMIRMFATLHETGGIPVPSRIAADLSVALVTTFWGLLIAIPALSVFGIFRNRIDMLGAECALAAERLIAVFKPEAAERDPAGLVGAGAEAG